jgi:hypothetical protein
MWSATHGLITLELGDYLIAPYDADRCFEALLVGLMVGAGDGHEAASRSVTASLLRFATEITSVPPAEPAEPENENGERPEPTKRSRVSSRPAARRAAPAD